MTRIVQKATLQRALVADVQAQVVAPLRDWVKFECAEIIKARDDLKRKRSALDSAVKHSTQAKANGVCLDIPKCKMRRQRAQNEDATSMAERKQADAQMAHDAAKETMDEFLGRLPAYQAEHEHIIKTFD